jgi:hypothetical protein
LLSSVSSTEDVLSNMWHGADPFTVDLKSLLFLQPSPPEVLDNMLHGADPLKVGTNKNTEGWRRWLTLGIVLALW